MADNFGTVIGRVSIKVVPDTRSFRRDAQRQLDAIEKTLEAEVKLTLIPELDESAKAKVEREMKRLIDKLDGKSASIEPELAESARLRTQARMAILARDRIVQLIPVVSRTAATKAGITLAALSGARVIGNYFDDIAEAIGRLDRNVPIIGTLAEATAGLAGYALSASSNLFALSKSLAEIGGSFLALPGIITGGVIAVGAFVAVMRDFNKVFPGVKKQLAELQNQMSGNFWGEAEKPVRNFLDKLLPEFSKGLRETSTALGHLFGDLADSARQALAGQITPMFDDLNRAIEIGRKGTDGFAGVITTLGTAGARELPRLARFLVGITNGLDAWLSKAQKTGQLNEWIDTGVEQLKELGRVLSNVGGILAGVARAADEAGGSSLAMMADTLERVHKAVDSQAFQTGLVNVLRNAHEAMTEIAEHSGKSFKALLADLGILLGKVLPRAGDTIGRAFDAIFKSLDQPVVAKSIEALFKSLDDAVRGLAPHLPDVADGLAAIVRVAGSLARNIGPAIGKAFGTLGKAVDTISGPLQKVIESLGDEFLRALDLLAPSVQKFADALARVLPVLGQMGGSAIPALAEALKTVLDAATAVLNIIDLFPGDIIGLIGHLAGLAIAWRALNATLVQTKAQLGIAATSVKTTATATDALATSTERASLKSRIFSKQLARGGAMIGGLELMTRTADSSNESLQALGKVGGSALIGFGLGGPIGGAIGAGVGALSALGEMAGDTSKMFGPAAQNMIRGYGDTLDQLTGKVTGTSRAFVIAKLNVAGFNDDAGNLVSITDSVAALGLNMRDVVSATMGQRDAQKRVNEELSKYLDKNGFVKSQYAGLANDIGNIQQTLPHLKNQIREQVAAQRDAIAAGKTWREVLAGLPKEVRTKIIADHGEETLRQVRELSTKYNLTPKQIITVFKANGLLSVNQGVDGFVKKLKDIALQHPNLQPWVNSLLGQLDRGKVNVKPKLDAINDVLNGVGKVNDAVLDPFERAIDRGLAQAEAQSKKGAGKVRGGIEDEVGDTKADLSSFQRTLHGSLADMVGVGRSGGFEIGQAIKQGANNGLAGMVSQLATSAANAVNSAIRAAKKAGDIRSPSRKMRQIGEFLMQGLIEGIDSLKGASDSKVIEIIDSILGKFKDARDKIKALHGDAGKALLNSMTAEAQKLRDLEREYDNLGNKLDHAKRQYIELRNEARNYAASIRDSIIATGDITQFVDPESGKANFTDIVKGLRDARDNAKAFAKVLERLKKRGLSDSAIDQLAQAGPETGLATARAILQAGQEGIDQINALQAQIARAARAAGETAKDALFKSGLEVAHGLVKGLEDARKPILDEMREIAREMVKVIKQELDIHSPSRVFRELGSFVGQGFTLGIRDEHGAVNDAIRGMGSARPGAAGSLNGAVAAAGPSVTNERTLVYHAAPGSSIDSEEDLFAAIDRGRGWGF